MTWWLNVILIGWLSFLSLGLGLPDTLATDQRAVVQPIRDNEASLFTIAPELANPNETPVSETEPETVSWLDEVLSSTESDADGKDDLDLTLDRWLSSVKTFFAGQ